ncbi:hypothetical protein HPB52_022853 [Rhipicephalus sanguineus]|uniref:BPTI/Kunitz inhibitor domain-containing protein n=1 Tax=Rhipicephalus sanguineus TaxID=34632 RepID=A0A9D4TBT6_RHISA|nr:hypothetical protein HPB52_022853 [Rhipicephalus sanguineus]
MQKPGCEYIGSRWLRFCALPAWDDANEAASPIANFPSSDVFGADLCRTHAPAFLRNGSQQHRARRNLLRICSVHVGCKGFFGRMDRRLTVRAHMAAAEPSEKDLVMDAPAVATVPFSRVRSALVRPAAHTVSPPSVDDDDVALAPVSVEAEARGDSTDTADDAETNDRCGAVRYTFCPRLLREVFYDRNSRNCVEVTTAAEHEAVKEVASRAAARYYHTSVDKDLAPLCNSSPNRFSSLESCRQSCQRSEVPAERCFDKALFSECRR